MENENPKVNLALVQEEPQEVARGTVYMSPKESGNFIKVATDSSTLVTIYDGNDLLTPITYDELKNLRDNDMLEPGMRYRITDYVTEVQKTNYSSAGHRFDIIVLATSVNTLSEDAKAIKHEFTEEELAEYSEEEIHYFDKCNLEAWELKYCLDNDVERFDWVEPESRFLVYSIYGMPYVEGGEDYEAKRGGVKSGGINTCDLTFVTRDPEGDKGGFYAWIDADDNLYSTSVDIEDMPSNDYITADWNGNTVIFYCAMMNNDEIPDSSSLTNYYMTSTYMPYICVKRVEQYDTPALIEAGWLAYSNVAYEEETGGDDEPGEAARGIADSIVVYIKQDTSTETYKTAYYNESGNWLVCGNAYDVTGLDNSPVYIRIPQNEGGIDVYREFYVDDIVLEEQAYCTGGLEVINDNISNAYFYFETESGESLITELPTENDNIVNGYYYTNDTSEPVEYRIDYSLVELKGVIYRMIDEFRNDMPYDFKNIMWKTGNDYYLYTFSYPVGNIADGIFADATMPTDSATIVFGSSGSENEASSEIVK